MINKKFIEDLNLWFVNHDLTNVTEYAKSVNTRKITNTEIRNYVTKAEKTFMIIETLVNDEDFPMQQCLVYDDPKSKIPTLYYHDTGFKYSTSFISWDIFGFEKIVELTKLKTYIFHTSGKFGIGIKIVNPLYIIVYDLEYKANGNGYYLTQNLALNSPEQLKYLLTPNQTNILKYIRLAIKQFIFENIENTNNHPIYVIKVKDYTTEIVCRYNSVKDEYYIQRGDGKILQTYSSDRVISKELLKT